VDWVDSGNNPVADSIWLKISFTATWLLAVEGTPSLLCLMLDTVTCIVHRKASHSSLYVNADLLTSSTAVLILVSNLMLFSWNICWQRSCPCNSSTCWCNVRFSSCNQQKQDNVYCRLKNWNKPLQSVQNKQPVAWS